ncbi:MAG: RNA-binding protein [Fusobacteria bacterium]|nr:MAG: RNA-binding protein [Fusobacteriota bacterium]
MEKKLTKDSKIKVGKRQKLTINNISSIGAYLDAETGNPDDNILLPNNQIEDKNLSEGDIVDVFVYRDSEDRLIATFEASFAVAGTMAKLKVVDLAPFGAFLDWGLSKDLLLPKGQEECRVEVGKTYLVGLFEDKKGRISATMNVYKFLLPNFELEKNELVVGTIYRIVPEIGIFVAIEDRYYGLIPNNEFFGKYKVGDEIQARVIRTREDGKVDLSPRLEAYKQMDKDAEMILDAIQTNYHKKLSISDKASPEEIKKEFGLSKKAFKRAIGRLLKARLIEKTDSGFKLTETGKSK